MPTVSKKQEKFMQAVAHNPKFAKATGVPQSVGKEFTKSGGGMKKSGSVKKMAVGGMGKAVGQKPGVKKMAVGGTGAPPPSTPKPAPTGTLKQDYDIKNNTSTSRRPAGSTPQSPTYSAANRPAVGTPLQSIKFPTLTGPLGKQGKPTAKVPGLHHKFRKGTMQPPKGGGGTGIGGGGTSIVGHLSSMKPQAPAQQNQKAVDPNLARLSTQMKMQEAGQMGTGSQSASKGGSAKPNLQFMSNALRSGTMAKPLGKKAGGLAAGHKAADGVAVKGKTKAMQVKMASGGLAAGHKAADGVAVKGKTKAMQVKMASGGRAKKYC
jgi:hypothetical protein